MADHPQERNMSVDGCTLIVGAGIQLRCFTALPDAKSALARVPGSVATASNSCPVSCSAVVYTAKFPSSQRFTKERPGTTPLVFQSSWICAACVECDEYVSRTGAQTNNRGLSERKPPSPGPLHAEQKDDVFTGQKDGFVHRTD